jgi:hypothetical protein
VPTAKTETYNMPSIDPISLSSDIPVTKTTGHGAKSLVIFTAKDVQELRSSLSEGTKVAQEQDPEYENGISRWSKAAEKRAVCSPSYFMIYSSSTDICKAIVVFPKTPEDVSKAILFSVKHSLEVAVSGGGHATSGASSAQGGININLSLMKQVSIDVEKKNFTAEGGALWSDVDVLAGHNGLAVLGGTVNHTGVSGLTLGGGYSYLTPSHGMTIDNLLAVEYVLADGSIVTASDTENPDLFWAARGAGSCFGVVTKFVFRCHDQPNNIWAAKIVFDAVSSFDQVWDFANAYMEEKDNKSWLFVGFGNMLPGDADKRSIFCICFYNGNMEEAMSIFGPLTKVPGQYYSKQVLMPYYEMNAFVNEGKEHGLRRSIKSCAFMPTTVSPRETARTASTNLYKFVKELPDAKKSVILFEFFQSDKICEIEQTATAFANRGRFCNSFWVMTWEDPNNDDRVRDFTRDEAAVARRIFDVDRAKLASERNIDATTLSSVGEYFNLDRKSHSILMLYEF